MWQYNYSDEIYHYGIKGMRWGVRRSRAQLVRNKSSAYNSEKNEWIKEPEGGSIKKQINVMNAENRLKLAKTREEKKTAKAGLEQAKKDLKDGYKEYQTFEKDMAKKYGKTSQYVFDPDTKKFTNKKTGKTVKDYEYTGMQMYEAYKTAKRIKTISNIYTGIGVVSAILAASNSIGSVPYRRR